MPTTRTRRTRAHTPPLTPDLRAKVVRLLELEEAHLRAIRDEPGTESFYTDGRHEELVGLVADVYPAAGIKLWDREPDELLRAALAAAEKADRKEAGR